MLAAAPVDSSSSSKPNTWMNAAIALWIANALGPGRMI